MKLPYQIRSRVNTSPRFQEHMPADWQSRKDWENFEGTFRTADGRFKIVEDDKYGLVISEIKNVNYTMD